jgi:hypothetical protein
MTNDKKLGKYLYFSSIRVSNLVNYMKYKNYPSTSIDSLFNSDKSSLASIYYLLGLLKNQGIDKIGKEDLIELSKNEDLFRTSLANTKNQKIASIFSEFNIKSENILESNPSARDPRDLNPYEFMKLAIDKKDLNLVEILRKKKEILDFKDF